MARNEQGAGPAVRGGVARKAKVGVLAALVVVPLGLLAVPAGASAMHGVQDCGVEELSVPSGWSDVDVVAGDASGRYLVGSDGADSVLWADGAVEEIVPPGGSDDPLVHDVNSSGVAVGDSFDLGSYTGVAWVYEDGAALRLAEPQATEYSDYTATGVNDAGDVVGYYDTGDHYQPVLWSADSPDEIQELSLEGSAGSVQPIDISEEGVIIGRERDGDGNHVFVWPDADSDGSRLASPAGSDQVRAYDINGDWVAGREGTGDEAVGVLWNLADGSSTTLPEPLAAVNSEGDATTSGPTATRYGSDGTETELPALSDTSVGRTSHVAFAQASAYVAAGSDRDADGTDHPVVWSDC